MKLFSFSYTHEGKAWSGYIHALDWADAMRWHEIDEMERDGMKWREMA